jgi:hypothetical protein
MKCLCTQEPLCGDVYKEWRRSSSYSSCHYYINVSGEVHAGSVISVIQGVCGCESDFIKPILFISFTIKRGPHYGYAHGQVRRVRESVLYRYVIRGT